MRPVIVNIRVGHIVISNTTYGIIERGPRGMNVVRPLSHTVMAGLVRR